MKDTAEPAIRPAMALASLSLATLLPSLGTSIANVGLPAIADAFGTSFQHVQWVVLAYLLAITSTIVSAGRLGDLAGRRAVLLGGIALFVAGSAACAAAPTFALLVLARAVQGLGAAAMMALAMALASEAVPKDRTGSAMGMLATMSAVGTALGPSLGGILVARFGWQALFLVNLPMGLAALALAGASLPVRPPPAAKARFDHPGTVVLALGLTAYALAMTTGRGRFGMVNLVLILVAAAAGALFVAVEKRGASPLIQLSILRDPQLRASFAMSALVSTVVMATLVASPFYLTAALRLTPARVGLVMSTGPVVAAAIGIPAGRMADRYGAARVSRAGLYAMALGTVGFATAAVDLGMAGYILPLVLVTGGYGLFQAANNTAVMAGAGPGQRGVVSGVLTLARNLGLVSGASVMGALFASGMGTHDLARATPAAAASGMHLAYTVAACLIATAIVIARTSGDTGQADKVLPDGHK